MIRIVTPEDKDFHDLGEAEIGETKEIPFYVHNIGTYPLNDIKVETTYPDTSIKSGRVSTIKPNDKKKFVIVWEPSTKTEKLARSGEKRKGEILVSGREIL